MSYIPDVMYLVGAVLVTYGAFQISLPVAFISAGVILLVSGTILAFALE